MIFFLAVLIISNLSTLAFFTFRESPAESFNNPFPLVDPARNFIAQENFIVNIQPLREDLNRLVAENKQSEIAIYFEVLNTGSNISINQEKRFVPGSLIKMPTVLAVMKKVERGEWKLDNELVLFYEDRNEKFGTLYKKPAGTKLKIEELLKELLVNSDDTAHQIFIRNLAAENFEEVLEGMGLESLYDKDYNITAKEYSRIFRALYTSSFLKREGSQELLQMLAETPFNDYLAGEIPGDITFSHKIGEHDEKRTYLDSGIVYVPDRPYLLTVMVSVKEGESREQAERIMKQISKKAYEYVKNN